MFAFYKIESNYFRLPPPNVPILKPNPNFQFSPSLFSKRRTFEHSLQINKLLRYIVRTLYVYTEHYIIAKIQTRINTIRHKYLLVRQYIL